MSIIKDHAVWFVKSLVQAVERLHVLGIAHLDIRLENICMKVVLASIKAQIYLA